MTVNRATCSDRPLVARPPAQPGAAQLRDLDGAAHEAGPEPGHAAQVGQGGGDDVDARVEVVDPVHRDLVDAQPGAFGQHEQLGVEEPAGIGGEREQRPRLVAPDRLEAALRVGKARPHQGPQQQVVAARDELPLGTADDPGTTGEPGADGQVAVPGQQRRDQREQGVQVCRQIDIHVGEDVGLALRPDGPQRPATSRQFHVDGAHLGQLAGQPVGDRPGGVGAAVIRDGDPGAKREALTQVGDQPPHARREITLLITNRHHNVHMGNSHGNEDRRPRSVAAEANLCTRYEQRGPGGPGAARSAVR